MNSDPDITASGPEDALLRERAARLRGGDSRPNILLVFTDQQTASAMSCAGNRWVETPAMDALARRGVRFVNSYCAAPVCGPSRAAMVTGLPPHQNGVVYNGDPLRPDLPTIGSVLRSAGYYTAWTGKWHLPESFLREEIDSHGFHHRPLTPGVPWCALGDQTDFLTAMDAEFFLRWQAAKQPKPWFLGVSLHNPHDICYHVVEDVLTSANMERFPPLPENFAADPCEPEALRLRRQNTRYGHELASCAGWDEARWRTYLHTYAHLVTQVDRAVGSVLRALEAGGWRQNTIVIFTSDHGEGVAAHQWATKQALYEEVVGVPLILSGPGIASGITVSQLASGLDLLPTMCDFAGADAPAGLPGRSLRQALSGVRGREEERVICELAADQERPEIQGRMVRTPRFKYMAYSPGEPAEQLFDLAADPGEMNNLAGDARYHSDLLRHRRLLLAWCLESEDPFLEVLPFPREGG